MRLPEPLYNAVPAIYFLMGIATWYFAVEAVVLEKGPGYAVFLAVAALVLIWYGFYIKRLRRRSRVAREAPG
jgi:Flp pilus assembly protein TadB